MRLIDADALLEAYDLEHVGPPGRARKLIEEAPEAVVRCKGCKHRSNEMYGYYGNPNNMVYVCQIHDLAKSPDWFCADGERRVDDA